MLSSTGKVVSGHGNEPGKFKHPMCVALSTDAHILVDDETCRLQKFTFASCYTGGFGVAVHSTSGKFFCTSHKERKIMVLNA